jgi:hypothetical protein
MAPVDPHCHQVTLVDEAQGGHGSGGSGALGSRPGEPWEARHFEGNEVPLNEAARIH